MNLSIIILAAGQGTRMCSDLPKVLHPLGGQPLLQHALSTAQQFEAADIHVVIGHGAERVRKVFAYADVHWVIQAEQLGTGHAVAQVMPAVPDDHAVLVMYGDVPLIRRETLDGLQSIAGSDALALLTASLDDPTGYGRILRDAAGNFRIGIGLKAIAIQVADRFDRTTLIRSSNSRRIIEVQDRFRATTKRNALIG